MKSTISQMKSRDNLFSNKDLVVLFVPLIIEQLLAYFVGVADSMMVANVSESAISGVSLVDFIMQLLISVFAALATGGAVIAGQHLGARSKKDAQETSDQLVWFVTIFSLVIMVVLYLIKPLILNYLFGNITPEVKHDADTYFMIVVPSIPFLALYNAGAAIFRVMGNSRLPMVIMFFMNLVNIIGNAIGVFMLRAGVAGIAIPTLVSRAGAAILVIAMARRVKNELPLSPLHSLRPHWNSIRSILKIAVPYGLENGLFYLGRLMILTIVSAFGTAAIAANSAGGTLVPFQVLPAQSIGLGLTVIISKCVGAGDYRQARYYAKKVVGIAILACFFTCAIILALLPVILDIYNMSDSATQMTSQIVWTHGLLCVIIWPLGNLVPVIFRAANDAKYPMVVSITVMFIVRIGLAYVLCFIFNMGMFGTWIAMYCDWAVKAILHVNHYLRGKWTTYRTS